MLSQYSKMPRSTLVPTTSSSSTGFVGFWKETSEISGQSNVMVEMSDRIEGFYSTPNESFRLTLYSMTLPSLTSAFCPTTSTPRMFLTVFDDLLTASLMASSNPLLDVPTSSIIFPTGILSLSFSLPADYFTLSDETWHSQGSCAQGP